MKPTLLILALLAGCTATIAPPAAAPKSAVARTVAVDKNAWPDRRPISVFAVSQSSYRKPTNQNGWNEWWYADLRPDDKDYAAKFRKRFDDFFADSLTRAKRQNAQGMLIWDCEGSRRAHANTYGGGAGVRGLSDITAEQIKRWVDDCEKAGLWVGFCVRDSINIDGLQAKSWDPAATVADLMNESRARYGKNVRAFYWDSNGNEDPRENLWAMADYQVKRVRDEVGPDVLIIPEFYGPGYEKLGPIAPLAYDPSALPVPFVVLKPTNDKPTAKYLVAYRNALDAGAITLLAATWDSPENAWITPMLKAAGK
jgi:hypothetical protein